MSMWIECAVTPPPRDGRELLMKIQRDDGTQFVRVCVPKLFRADVWEYHRDEKFTEGHTWSMMPTHWMEIPS